MTIIIGTPHARGAGYYCNDDTASGGVKSQADIRTCTHCQAIIKMQEWKQDGGWCGQCSAPICPTCADRMLTHGCEPFIKKLEQALEMSSQLHHFRKLAGLEAPEPTRSIFTGIRR
jgi:hypothetical protein